MYRVQAFGPRAVELCIFSLSILLSYLGLDLLLHTRDFIV